MIQELTKEKQKKEQEKKIKRRKIFILSCLIFIVISPWIFTRNAWFEMLNFTGTGPIGDTIGGILGSFASLLGAILVYYSFQEQVKANALQIERLDLQNDNDEKKHNFNSLFAIFIELKSLSENVEYSNNKGFTEAIRTFKSENKGSYEEWINKPMLYQKEIRFDQQIRLLIGSYLIFLEKINNHYCFSLYDSDRRFLSSLFVNYIVSKEIDSQIFEMGEFSDVTPLRDACKIFNLYFDNIRTSLQLEYKTHTTNPNVV